MNPRVFKWSKWAIRLSDYSIFVSQKTIDLAKIQKQYTLLPCGVDIYCFKPVNKQTARQQLGWDTTGTYILFAGSKEIYVKNYPLAKQAIERIPSAKLIELKGYRRDEVNLALNAADVALMTSFSEGSPQFIKEALACNCPIVSTDVGDVKLLIEEIDGCFITSFEIGSVVESLQKALNFVSAQGRTEGRNRIEAAELTVKQVTTKLIEIYKQCIQHDATN